MDNWTTLQDQVVELLQPFRNVLVASLDEQGRIKNANIAFRNHALKGEVKETLNIADFVQEQRTGPFKLPEGNDRQDICLSFSRAGTWPNTFFGYIQKVTGGYIVICESFRLSYSEMLNRMTTVNNELTGLARDLMKRSSLLEKTSKKMTHLAENDALTRLANRRKFIETLSDALEQVKKDGQPLSLVMADLDWFKQVNDNFGHIIGDKVLQVFGDLLIKSTRQNDLPARVGGEEFVIILPNTPIHSAREFAERIRRQTENTLFPGVDHPITVSLGVSDFRQDDTVESLVERVDQALYDAKRSGRNRVKAH